VGETHDERNECKKYLEVERGEIVGGDDYNIEGGGGGGLSPPTASSYKVPKEQPALS